MRSRPWACVALLFVLAACGRYGTEYAAVVDGHTVTFDALERASRQTAPGVEPTIDVERRVLLQMVGRVLVDDELARHGIRITAAQVGSAVDRIKAGYPSEQVYEQQLALAGLNDITVLDQVRDQLAVSALSQIQQQPGAGGLQAYFDTLVRRADIEINPRIGDLDLSTMSIVDHRFFIPATPEPTPAVGLPPIG